MAETPRERRSTAVSTNRDQRVERLTLSQLVRNVDGLKGQVHLVQGVLRGELTWSSG